MTHPLVHAVTESVLHHHKPFAHIYIGYSGGVDSHVLLHLCASIPELHGKMTAVYVHHGLQAQAQSWSEHCQAIATSLHVNFIELRVNATAATGESPEEAARNARYTALKSLIGANEALLIAQHRDDQLETVLLQLFRGAGLRGLSGTPESALFGLGLILRPLLHTPKVDINHYATVHGLHWVEDPSNQQNDYDRNFLRNAVIPLLKERWPACDKTVTRSAKHCAEAQVIVSAVADELFNPVFNKADNTLCLKQLHAQKKTRQQLIIRHWFQHLGLRMPAQAFVERIQTDVIAAREDSNPIVNAQGCEIRRYRDKLYCLQPQNQVALEDMTWLAGHTIIKFADQRTLSYLPSSEGILYEQWQKAHVTIKFRAGGEKIRLPKRKETHTLKKLFQETGIPPWERETMPLIYLNNKLAAVGGLWISADFYSEKPQACIRLSLQNKQ